MVMEIRCGIAERHMLGKWAGRHLNSMMDRGTTKVTCVA